MQSMTPKTMECKPHLVLDEAFVEAWGLCIQYQRSSLWMGIGDLEKGHFFEELKRKHTEPKRIPHLSGVLSEYTPISINPIQTLHLLFLVIFLLHTFGSCFVFPPELSFPVRPKIEPLPTPNLQVTFPSSISTRAWIFLILIYRLPTLHWTKRSGFHFFLNFAFLPIPNTVNTMWVE